MGLQLQHVLTDLRTGRLSYRRRYPAALRPFLPSVGENTPWEFKVSLMGTRRCPDVMNRYRAAEQRYEAIEREARQLASGRHQPLDPSIIQFLADTYLATEIEHTNRSRRALPGTAVEDLRPYPSRADLEADWEASRELMSDDDYDLAGIVEMWGSWSQTFARSYGYLVQPEGQGFADLCQAMAQAACRLWLAVDPHERRGPITIAPKAPQRPTGTQDAATPAPTASDGDSKTVRDLLSAYRADKGPKWSKSTESAYAPACRLLEDVLGDRAVTTLTRDDARRIQALVKRLPKNLGKQEVLKGLGIEDAILKAEALGLPVIEPKTVNSGYIVLIAAVFAWAVREGWVSSNLFLGLTVADAVDDADRRDPFTVRQLNALFGSEPWTDPASPGMKRPGRYWVPMLALFQGARRGELAALRVMDVEELDGILALHIRPHERRALKNSASRRTVPVHPAILDLGFGEYVRDRRAHAKPDAFLFPDMLSKERGQFGYNLTAWLTLRIRDLKFEGTNLALHSFRHNFEDALRRAGLHGTPMGLALAGRDEGGSQADYGKGNTMADLMTALGNVTYPGLDLSAVKPWVAPGGS